MSTPDPSVDLTPVPAPTRGSGSVVCCGGHRERCLFGGSHVFATWFEGGRLMRTLDTYRCHACGGVCTADEDEQSVEKTAAWLAARQADKDDQFGTEPPSDPAAVQADDALLDALIAGEFDAQLLRAGVTINPVPAHPDAWLLALVKVLDAWRQDVDTEPVGELADTAAALAAIQSGYEPPKRVSPVFTGLIVALVPTIALTLLILALVLR